MFFNTLIDFQPFLIYIFVYQLIIMSKQFTKKNSTIWDEEYYSVTLESEKKITLCNFCRKTKFTNNATKMTDHLLGCKSVPQSTKERITEIFQPSKRLKANLSAHIPQCSTSSSNSSMEINNSESIFKPRRLTQTPIIHYATILPSAETKDITKSFAKWVYAANLPLSLAENPFFKEFAKSVNPAWKTPTCFELSDTLLKNEYNEAIQKQQQVLDKVKAGD